MNDKKKTISKIRKSGYSDTVKLLEGIKQKNLLEYMKGVQQALYDCFEEVFPEDVFPDTSFTKEFGEVMGLQRIGNLNDNNIFDKIDNAKLKFNDE